MQCWRKSGSKERWKEMRSQPIGRDGTGSVPPSKSLYLTSNLGFYQPGLGSQTVFDWGIQDKPGANELKRWAGDDQLG
jgi:hypothetical protein